MANERTPEQAMEYLTLIDLDTIKKTPLISFQDMKLVYDEFWKEYEAVEKGLNRDWIEYHPKTRELYDKYWKFALKCRDIAREIQATGWGDPWNDFAKNQIHTMARSIEYNFPFGWGDKHRKEK